MPSGLSAAEIRLFSSVRNIARAYRAQVIDYDRAGREVKQASDAYEQDECDGRLVESTYKMWARINVAGTAYSREPTREHADAFFNAVYGFRRTMSPQPPAAREEAETETEGEIEGEIG